MADSAVSVVWFRRDLRTADNRCLDRALGAGGPVVALFVWDDHLITTAGAARVSFLAGCVTRLREDLGGRLVIRRGDPVAVVDEVARQTGASRLIHACDFGPYGRERDSRVRVLLGERGVDVERADSPYLVPPGRIRNAAGRPFQIFTPFSRAWRSEVRVDPAATPSLSGLTDLGLRSDRLPETGECPGIPEPGEAAGEHRLEEFVFRGARPVRFAP
jgi:deoxyribodipyrimidine photo-lyase